MLATGEFTQTQIADRLGLTRQYICQFVKKLLNKDLIKTLGDPSWVVRFWKESESGNITPCRELFRTKEEAEEFTGKITKHSVHPPIMEYLKSSTRYNICYELNPYLKKQIEHEIPDIHLSACRVHNVRMKYPITISGEISTDWRTGYIMSWKMRGGTRHKFSVSGTAGRPDITIDVHPNSIVAYPVAGQTIYAASIEESKALLFSTIEKAISIFIQKQNQFGVEIEVRNPSLTGKAGELISNIHFGFKFRKDGIAGSQTTIPEFENDGSPEKNGEKGYSEFETENEAKATELDSAVIDINEGRRKLGKNPFIALYDELMEIKEELFNRNSGVIA